ncbi:MAG: hypothetical protein QM811_21995 [Pirellulales bacterium]
MNRDPHLDKLTRISTLAPRVTLTDILFIEREMGDVLGYHWVKSGYGLWLPGDERGHWSSKWDEELGFIEPHKLHSGDPIRARMAAERLIQEPVELTAEMRRSIEDTLDRCMCVSDWRIVAAAIETTHIHVLMTRTVRDIERTLTWLAQETTKSIHLETAHRGHVWCKGRWNQYVFEHDHWDKTIDYIERHNERRGLGRRPYRFLRDASSKK